MYELNESRANALLNNLGIYAVDVYLNASNDELIFIGCDETENENREKTEIEYIENPNLIYLGAVYSDEIETRTFHIDKWISNKIYGELYRADERVREYCRLFRGYENEQYEYNDIGYINDVV